MPFPVTGGTKKLLFSAIILILILWEFVLPGAAVGPSHSPGGPASLLPPLIAITMALVTREVIISLFCGVWIGATILSGYQPLGGLTATLDTFLVRSLSSEDHATIILFSLGFGGIIGVIGANGGMKGIVEKASQYARTPRSSQMASMLMGIVIFFDDYANTLFVGNMMRPFTDKMKVSREKLSYLVDSTAAPVASLAIISTWSVFQMSLLEGPYDTFGIQESPYITFLKSIPFSFYCILTLFFMVLLLFSGRDYGPMRRAEIRARVHGKVLGDDARPLSNPQSVENEKLSIHATHWSNAMVPIMVVIGVTLLGLYVTGRRGLAPGVVPTVRNIVGSSNSYASLMWGSYLAGFTAIGISVARGLLTLRKAVESWLAGVRSMVLACIVLVLAWSLGDICGEVGTAGYLIKETRSFLTAGLLPPVTFLTAALVSFSTGTSWGTMSILVPIVIPMSFNLVGGQPADVVGSPAFLATFAAILSGAVFGDHCSPISDTTILSSMASGADHVDHVRTQLPYAITVGLISMISGFFLVGMGIPWAATILLGLGAAGGAVWLFGRPLRIEPSA
ncbi:MAG: Na+/H+ antiporter NhaC family protein [Fidelibacterota bacterium]